MYILSPVNLRKIIFLLYSQICSDCPQMRCSTCILHKHNKLQLIIFSFIFLFCYKNKMYFYKYMVRTVKIMKQLEVLLYIQKYNFATIHEILINIARRL